MAQTTTYSKKPRSIAEYTMMRGVTDYTNAAQFNLYESGYSFLTVITKPNYIEKLALNNAYVKNLLNTFCYILQYEFRGLEGIEDITAENITVTDGISELNTIGKVVQQSATEVTMTFTEKSGTCITKFIDLYLRGIKDPRTQAKTYHGLIKNGVLAGGFEHEIFNLLYIVTDNTCLGLEKAYLLVNAWPNKAPTSIFNSTKGEIDKKEIDVTMSCFVIDGEQVNQRALKMLAYINEANAVKNVANESLGVYSKEAYGTASAVTTYLPTKADSNGDKAIILDSNDYEYQGLKSLENAYKNQ